MRASFLTIAAGTVVLAGIGTIQAAHAQSTDKAMQHPAMMAPMSSKTNSMSHQNSMQHGMMKHAGHMDSMTHASAMKNDKPQ